MGTMAIEFGRTGRPESEELDVIVEIVRGHVAHEPLRNR
jgi:hypothetical protein